MKLKITIVLVALLAGTLLTLPGVTTEVEYRPIEFDRIKLSPVTVAQSEWIKKLEWCESRNDPDAINPKDRDGTPSYGAFQFKPDTFWYYAEKYGVETPTLADQIRTTPVIDGKQTLRSPSYDRHYQLLVVEQMVAHRDEINWLQQFPDCVRNHIGFPPRR